MVPPDRLAILKSRCSRSSFFLCLSLSSSFLHSFLVPPPLTLPTLALFSFYCVPRLSFSPFPYLSFQSFFSFSFFSYDRVSFYFFLTLSLVRRGRYWGLRLRLSRGQRDHIVFRTIWLIECRWLEISPFLPADPSSPIVTTHIRTDTRKLYERVFKPRSRNRYLAKSDGRSFSLERQRLRRRNGKLCNWIGQQRCYYNANNNSETGYI